MKDIVIIGSEGLIGRALLNRLADCKGSINIHGIDIHDHSNQKSHSNFFYHKLDAFRDDIIEKLGLTKISTKMSFVNLAARDYPVDNSGLTSRCTDPFMLSPTEFADSMSSTAGIAHNLMHSICKHNICKVDIILVGSIYAHVLPNPTLYSSDSSLYKPIAYSMAKIAQGPLLKQAARYLGPLGGRCNCLSFGGIENNQHAQFVRAYSDLSPQGQLVPMNDVVRMLKWMIFDAPESLNGSEIILDGGFTCI